MFENHSQDTRYKGPVDVAPTVSATYGKGGNNQPFVTTAGFCTEHSSDSRSIGYEEEISPTLRAGVVPAAVSLNETPKTLKIRSGCEGGGKGALIQDDKSATLGCNNDQTVFVPTAFGICSDKSNSMQSSNPHSGIYEADTSRTIDANGGNPGCNQGGIAVVALQGSMIGRQDKNGPQGDGINDNMSFTLNTVDRHGVVYAIDRETFNCGQNFARNLGITEDSVASTLNAQGPSAVAQPYQNVSGTISAGAHPSGFNGQDASNDMLVTVKKNDEPEYIVRRLTPTECARLQGFPDDWCDDLGTENPTEDEILFWTEVWETHRKIMGKSSKPKTRKQIIKWLNNPHSDSAEYKMWGNGVALPCVCFVLTGIVLSAENTAE
jgi:DNA (cytosine-5)-methyltransferase 1